MQHGGDSVRPRRGHHPARRPWPSWSWISRVADTSSVRVVTHV
ncbi:hypothetical protein LI90_492 [Carbonactinospora thermoautotrophica]|uniref:Uncharacterized protein n=1 Tax=Carbonactinospora thermoautotrophica TaxID=1469144 RepID=A0A132MLX2_9ACTN|nr:hypothetical protein LI90_492 [Carbonactinospora thermoautotrophica]